MKKDRFDTECDGMQILSPATRIPSITPIRGFPVKAIACASSGSYLGLIYRYNAYDVVTAMVSRAITRLVTRCRSFARTNFKYSIEIREILETAYDDLHVAGEEGHSFVRRA